MTSTKENFKQHDGYCEWIMTVAHQNGWITASIGQEHIPGLLPLRQSVTNNPTAMGIRTQPDILLYKPEPEGPVYQIEVKKPHVNARTGTIFIEAFPFLNAWIKYKTLGINTYYIVEVDGKSFVFDMSCHPEIIELCITDKLYPSKKEMIDVATKLMKVPKVCHQNFRGSNDPLVVFKADDLFKNEELEPWISGSLMNQKE